MVTGASGSLAQLVLEELLDIYRVPPEKLLAVTRSVHKLKRIEKRGVKVRFGDFDKPNSLKTAFAGGSVYFNFKNHLYPRVFTGGY